MAKIQLTNKQRLNYLSHLHAESRRMRQQQRAEERGRGRSPLDTDERPGFLRGLLPEAVAGGKGPSAMRSFYHGFTGAWQNLGRTVGATLPDYLATILPEGTVSEYLHTLADSRRDYWNVEEELTQNALYGTPLNPETQARRDQWGQIAGSTISSLAMLLSTGGNIGTMGKALGWSDRMITLAQVGSGAGVGGTLEGGRTFEETLQRGGSHQEAATAGTLQAINAALLNSLSLGFIYTKFPPHVQSTLRRKARDSVLKRAGWYGASGGIEGTIEMGVELSNAATQHIAGLDDAKSIREAWEDATSIFGPVALTTALFFHGTGMGGLHNIPRTRVAAPPAGSTDTPLQHTLKEVAAGRVEVPGTEGYAPDSAYVTYDSLDGTPKRANLAEYEPGPAALMPKGEGPGESIPYTAIREVGARVGNHFDTLYDAIELGSLADFKLGDETSPEWQTIFGVPDPDATPQPADPTAPPGTPPAGDGVIVDATASEVDPAVPPSRRAESARLTPQEFAEQTLQEYGFGSEDAVGPADADGSIAHRLAVELSTPTGPANAITRTRNAEAAVRAALESGEPVNTTLFRGVRNAQKAANLRARKRGREGTPLLQLPEGYTQQGDLFVPPGWQQPPAAQLALPAPDRATLALPAPPQPDPVKVHVDPAGRTSVDMAALTDIEPLQAHFAARPGARIEVPLVDGEGRSASTLRPSDIPPHIEGPPLLDEAVLELSQLPEGAEPPAIAPEAPAPPTPTPTPIEAPAAPPAPTAAPQTAPAKAKAKPKAKAAPEVAPQTPQTPRADLRTERGTKYNRRKVANYIAERYGVAPHTVYRGLTGMSDQQITMELQALERQSELVQDLAQRGRLRERIQRYTRELKKPGREGDQSLQQRLRQAEAELAALDAGLENAGFVMVDPNQFTSTRQPDGSIYPNPEGEDTLLFQSPPPPEQPKRPKGRAPKYKQKWRQEVVDFGEATGLPHFRAEVRRLGTPEGGKVEDTLSYQVLNDVVSPTEAAARIMESEGMVRLEPDRHDPDGLINIIPLTKDGKPNPSQARAASLAKLHRELATRIELQRRAFTGTLPHTALDPITATEMPEMPPQEFDRRYKQAHRQASSPLVAAEHSLQVAADQINQAQGRVVISPEQVEAVGRLLFARSMAWATQAPKRRWNQYFDTHFAQDDVFQYFRGPWEVPHTVDGMKRVRVWAQEAHQDGYLLSQLRKLQEGDGTYNPATEASLRNREFTRQRGVLRVTEPVDRFQPLETGRPLVTHKVEPGVTVPEGDFVVIVEGPAVVLSEGGVESAVFLDYGRAEPQTLYDAEGNVRGLKYDLELQGVDDTQVPWWEPRIPTAEEVATGQQVLEALESYNRNKDLGDTEGMRYLNDTLRQLVGPPARHRFTASPDVLEGHLQHRLQHPQMVPMEGHHEGVTFTGVGYPVNVDGQWHLLMPEGTLLRHRGGEGVSFQGAPSAPAPTVTPQVIQQDAHIYQMALRNDPTLTGDIEAALEGRQRVPSRGTAVVPLPRPVTGFAQLMGEVLGPWFEGMHMVGYGLDQQGIQDLRAHQTMAPQLIVHVEGPGVPLNVPGETIVFPPDVDWVVKRNSVVRDGEGFVREVTIQARGARDITPIDVTAAEAVDIPATLESGQQLRPFQEGVDPQGWDRGEGAEGGRWPLLHQQKKGATAFFGDERGTPKALVALFPTADFSTVIHELGHVFREDIVPSQHRHLVEWVNAQLPESEKVREKDGKWLWTRAAEEVWADGFVSYFKDKGKTKMPKNIATIADSFKTWLANIYEGAGLGVRLTGDARKQMHELFHAPWVDRGYSKMARKQREKLARKMRFRQTRAAGEVNLSTFSTQDAALMEPLAAAAANLDPDSRPTRANIDNLLAEGLQLYNDTRRFHETMQTKLHNDEPLSPTETMALYLHVMHSARGAMHAIQNATNQQQRNAAVRKLKEGALKMYRDFGTIASHSFNLRFQLGFLDMQETLINELSRATNARSANMVFSAIDDFLANPNTQTLAAVQKSYEGAPVGTRDIAIQLMYNGMLSSFSTQAVNAATNTVHMAWLVGPHRALTALVDAGMAAVIPGRQREVFLSEVKHTVSGLIRGFPLGAKPAKQIITTGERMGFEGKRADADTVVIEEYSKLFDITGEQQVALEYKVAEYIAENRLDVRNPHAAAMLRKVAGILTVPTRLLRAVDYMGTVAAYEGFFGGLVERRIQQQLRTGELKPGQVESERAKMHRNRPKDLHSAAILEARNSIFTDPPGPLSQSAILYKRSAPIAGNFFLPFVTTLVNLVKRGAELTPGVGVAMHAREARSIASKRGSQRHLDTQASMVAKQIQGLLATALLLSMFGDEDEEGFPRLVGALPESHNKRAAYLRRGILPYSIRIGDTYVSFARMEPFAYPLGVAAEAYAALREYREGADDPNKQNHLVSHLMGAAGKMMVYAGENTFLSSGMRLMDPYQSPAERLAEEGVRRLLSFIPYNGVLRDTSKTLFNMEHGGQVTLHADPNDPWPTKLVMDSVSRVVPFGQQILQHLDKGEIRSNVWGEPQKHEVNAFFREWLPWRYQQAQSDVVEEELYNIGYYPSVPIPSRQMKIGDFVYPVPQDLYESFAVDVGVRTKERFRRTIESSGYQRRDPGTWEGQTARHGMLSRDLRRERDRATSRLEREMRQRIRSGEVSALNPSAPAVVEETTQREARRR